MFAFAHLACPSSTNIPHEELARFNVREVSFELVLTLYAKLAIKYKICDRQILQDNELDCRASTDETIYSLDMVRVADWLLLP